MEQLGQRQAEQQRRVDEVLKTPSTLAESQARMSDYYTTRSFDKEMDAAQAFKLTPEEPED